MIDLTAHGNSRDGHRGRSLRLALAVGLGAIALVRAPAAAAERDPLVLVPACIALDALTDSATVIVHNRGTTSVAWQLEFLRMARTAAGTLRALPGSDPAAAIVDTSVEVTPREFLLMPGESRLVCLRIRRPLVLACGEYRSHLVVREKSPLTAAGGDAVSGAGAVVPIVLRAGPAVVRWRDEQFRAGTTHAAPAIVILDLEAKRPGSAS